MKNILLEGCTGSGKTFLARAMAYYICKLNIDIDMVYGQDIYGDIQQIDSFVSGTRCEYIQIHPSMTYEDIVYGTDVNSQGSITVEYAEKRIMRLCERAKGQPNDLYCIILDDVTRANPGALLGNLLYAMEYRNQSITLCDGHTLSVPNNVVFILTASRENSNYLIDLSIRRRMDYVKTLQSDRNVLVKRYSNVVARNALNLILNTYDTTCAYIASNFCKDPNIDVRDYWPGHGLFLVEVTGTPYWILERFKEKYLFQVYPFLVEMYARGIIMEHPKSFCLNVINGINTGQIGVNEISNIRKIFVKSRADVTPFSVVDSKNFYANTLIPAGCKEYKGVLECIIDALILNGTLPLDVVMGSLLTNINVAVIKSKSIPVRYASYLVKENEASIYYYETPRNGVKVSHAFYSSKPAKAGRWKAMKDSIAYAVSYADGRTEDIYLPLIGFRNHNHLVDSPVIHPLSNAANIYGAVYRLLDAYIDCYMLNVSLIRGTDSAYIELYNLLCLEKRYLALLHEEIKNYSGDDAKIDFFGGKLLNFHTVWNNVGSVINVDETKYTALLGKNGAFSINEYEDIYNISTTTKTILLKGVLKMVDLKDYQLIMENIGVRQMIFQGPPGTSKTFESKKFILQKLNPSANALSAPFITPELITNDLDAYKLTVDDYKDPLNSPKFVTGGWDLVQFHPSYGYEDFIRGIDVQAPDGVVTYESANRIMGKIAEFALDAAEAAEQAGREIPNFYLCVDEINRANLATVFGELIYGLEYRDSEVSTPYEVKKVISGTVTKDIIIAKNLYIIGTMNTADKSIDTIDYAVRRRFIFVDSPSSRDTVLECYQKSSGLTNDDCIELVVYDAVQMLFEDERFFNEEYQKNDVRLGHTYFLRNSQTNYADILVEKFVFQVIPILREYMKDGILETTEDLIAMEHSIAEICAVGSREEKISMLSENILMFVKEFGNANLSGIQIDNHYVGKFIDDLRIALGY